MPPIPNPYSSPPRVRNWLAAYLPAHCSGRAAALTGRELLKRAAADDMHCSHRQLRAALADLIEVDALPVCSLPRDGYWWATDCDELNVACRDLRSRSLAALYRMGRLADYGRHHLGGQARLADLPSGRELKSAVALLEGDDGE